jgi:hypothetical protein
VRYIDVKLLETFATLWMIGKMTDFAKLMILLNFVLAEIRLNLKNDQVGGRWCIDDYS